MSDTHTIALIQVSKHDSTRFYTDYSNIEQCLEGILRMYETKLKEANPGAKGVTYDYVSLCLYIDDLKEITVLSWDRTIQGYRRYDRLFVKSGLHDLCANAVARRR
ncbi:enhancer of rudimentary [Dunaliella salina]|uniref:Enhancer of rudimentary n=1 Tax=Dunaliella salina TaxID=3046 RepID=A0ABQ7H7J0_DUNSA|nr:enhancer of rudimentary [Dunaliella salina]|eukprot:KAF5842820.1 enhancer of rudimentary [Dunaliella salina]